MLPEVARVFLETSSIRGVGKVVKTQNHVLSRMWAVFLLGSTSLLFYSVYKITAEYLQYDVNIQTYQEIDDVSPFPAVSICNNQPFSLNAYQKWSTNKVKSPTVFSNELKQVALKLMNESNWKQSFRKLREIRDLGGNPIKSQVFQGFMPQVSFSMANSLIFDSVRMYYQNMPGENATELGYTRNEAIIDCIFNYKKNLVLGGKGCHDYLIKVETFSDPNFFNCLTLKFVPQSSHDINSLTLIVWLGPDEGYDIRHRQSFLSEVYEQAYGLRVVIHEPDTQPRVIEQGIQTEPGKMNEIKYQPVRFLRADTPKNPCISAEAAAKIRFSDLNATYNYDYELCLNSKVQEVVMRKCNCMYIELPRISVPNNTHPYCGNLDENIQERFRCVRALDLLEIRKSFKGKECFPKCSDLIFEKELSTTRWREAKWMLYWIKESFRRWDRLIGQIYELNSEEEFEESFESVKDYLTKPNITDMKLLGNISDKEAFEFNDRFSFLVVRRQSNNTLIRKEKIVLTLNALFSRVGGLCSVYIGLTLTFIMECIDLIFRLVTGGRQKQQQQPQQQGPTQLPAGTNGATNPATPVCKVVELPDNPEEQVGLVKSVADLDFGDAPGGEAAATQRHQPDCRHNQIWVRKSDSRV